MIALVVPALSTGIAQAAPITFDEPEALAVFNQSLQTLTIMSAVPEPASIVMLGIGALGVFAHRRRP